MLSFFTKGLHLVNKFGEKISLSEIDSDHKLLTKVTNQVAWIKGTLE